MTETLVYEVVASLAALLGAIAGRAFAVEAHRRSTAIFAGTYVGAGAGLMTAVTVGSVLTLILGVLNGEATWFGALNVAGTALLYGTASGAAGGLAVSLVVATFNLRAHKQPPLPR
jgi:hypothetical protein